MAMASPNPSPAKSPAARVSTGMRRNSLNLPVATLVRLLNAFDAAESKPGNHAHRESSRWPFRLESIAVTLIYQGSTSEISVAGRNISRGGLAVLHNTYLHPGTECRVTLQHLRKGAVVLKGKIARCVHRAGVIHEIGIKLEEPIRVRDFIDPDPFSAAFTIERPDPRALTASVLIVEPDAAEREVMKLFLKDTCVRSTVVCGIGEAGEALRGCDLIVASAEASAPTPAATVQALRDGGALSPIILLTRDASPETRRTIQGVRAQAFLARPILKETLFRAIAEWTVVERSAWGGTRAGGESGIAGATHLGGCAQSLRSAITSCDPMVAKRACLQTRQLAEALACRSVAAMAEQILKAVDGGKDIEDMLGDLAGLASVCEAVGAVAEAKNQAA